MSDDIESGFGELASKFDDIHDIIQQMLNDIRRIQELQPIPLEIPQWVFTHFGMGSEMLNIEGIVIPFYDNDTMMDVMQRYRDARRAKLN